MQTPTEVVNEYLETFDSRNPDSMIQFFADEGFLIWGNRVWKGHAELKKFYEILFTTELPSDMEFEIESITTEDEVTQVIWRGQSPTRKILAGVDSIVVRNSKITSFTVHIEDEA